MKSGLFNKRDVIAYFFVAASGVPIQLLISSVSQNWFAISYRESLTVAYLVASVVGFFLTKIFAFSTKNATKTHREMVKFTMVAVLSFLITVYGSDALYKLSVQSFGVKKVIIPHSVKSVEVNKFLSQLACMGVSFISNFILHKRFTFRDTGFYERLKKLI
jgi:putative flippase GtrA